MKMKVIIGIVMLLYISKIETRKSATRNQDYNREDYTADDLTALFEFADESDSDGDYEESVLEGSEEELMLEALMKLMQAKYLPTNSKQKKVNKKGDGLVYKQKIYKNRQQKNRHDNYHNNYYQVDNKKLGLGSTMSCRLKGSLCMKKCDGDYRCRNACNARYQC